MHNSERTTLAHSKTTTQHPICVESTLHTNVRTRSFIKLRFHDDSPGKVQCAEPFVDFITSVLDCQFSDKCLVKIGTELGENPHFDEMFLVPFCGLCYNSDRSLV